MGRKCCVLDCRSNNNSEPGYTPVFQFPKEGERRQAWIRSIKRDNFTPIKSTVVCIRHFEDQFIVREDRATRDDGSILVVPRKHMGLSSDAVPTKLLCADGKAGVGRKTKMAPADVKTEEGVPASRRAKMAAGSSCKINCCVVGCTNYYAKFREDGRDISFYRFPTMSSWPARRLLWIAAINRQGPDGKIWTPKTHSRVCSEHFVGGKKIDHPRHPAFAPTIMPVVGKDGPARKQRKRARNSAVDWEELAALRDSGARSTAILPKLGAAERLMCRVTPRPPAERGGTALAPAEDDVDGDLPPHQPDGQLITKIKQEPVDYESEPALEQTPSHDAQPIITPNTSQILKNLRKLAPAPAAEPPSRGPAAPRSLLRTYSKGQQQQQGGEAENEFDLFCRSLAVQLKNMPLHRALACQEKLQSVMVQERLAQLRSRAEAMGCANTDLPKSETSCFPNVEAMYDDE